MRTWLTLTLLGVLLVIGAFIALANPFAASLAVTTLVGFFFLIGGAIQAWLAVAARADRHRMWHGVIGALGIVAGISLLANPLGGLISLTLLLGIVFLATGAARLVLAFRLRESRSFWFLLLSGAVSVLLGILIFGNFAAAATTLLGVLLGIQLLADGVALIALGIVSRRSEG